MKYLIVNPGSASKKYAFYVDNTEVFRAHLEKDGDDYIAHLVIENKKGKIKITEEEFKNPHKHMFDMLIANNFITALEEITAVGIRIVAPGTFFAEHKSINGAYIKRLKEAEVVAPLHLGPVLVEIKEIQEVIPYARLIGVSDSAFHKHRPMVSKIYGINRKDTEKYELYRNSYHGISLDSILEKLSQTNTGIPEKLIICHLGGGASITAIKNGKSIDSTMGFSPLEGLIMASRVGDIDAGALVYLAKKRRFSLDELELYLNRECGLLGISGQSSDIRQLLKLEDMGDKNAKLALDTYVYKIKKYLGAYIAALNGIDMIVFSGTVGERSYIMRERICSELQCFGIDIDKVINDQTIENDGIVSTSSSKVVVSVIHTEEVAEIAREVKKLLQ